MICFRCGCDLDIAGAAHHCVRPAPGTVAARRLSGLRTRTALEAARRARAEERKRSAKATQPWRQEGVSRSTWYRHRALVLGRAHAH